MPSVTEDGEVQGARLSRAIGGLALFDLDRTLVPDSSLVILARALASRRLVTTTALLSAMARNAKFVRGGASDATAAKTRDRVLAAVAGLEQSALSDVAHGVGRDVAADRGPQSRHPPRHRHEGRGRRRPLHRPARRRERLRDELGPFDPLTAFAYGDSKSVSRFPGGRVVPT